MARYGPKSTCTGIVNRCEVELSRMKSVSPWFQTAQLLNGIRKTVSEIEANRSAPADRNVRPADSAILQRVDEKKPN
jgi:hypothetical protein